MYHYYQYYAHNLELECTVWGVSEIRGYSATQQNKDSRIRCECVCVCVCVCGLGRHTFTNLTLVISKSIQPKFQELFGTTAVQWQKRSRQLGCDGSHNNTRQTAVPGR